MRDYEIVTILWEDHMIINRSELRRNPDKFVDTPTLTTGLLYKETKKTYTVIFQIEPYDDRDEVTYMVILKAAVQGIKRHGKMKLRKLG